MSWHVSPWIYPIWDFLGFLDLGGYSFPHVKEVFEYNLLIYFLIPFVYLLFFWDPYYLNLGALNVVPEVSEIVLTSFYSFFVILLCLSFSHHSSSLVHSSALIILLLVPSSVFLFSFIVLFIGDCLFFNSSGSLLSISCIFSIHASSLFICASILFPKFWILFSIITLNSCQVDCLFPLHLFGLVGFYHVSSSAAYFSVFSFYLIYCVWDRLSAGWKVVFPLKYGVCPTWLGFDQCLVKVSWLGGLVPVFWWMRLDLVSLKGSAISRSVLGWLWAWYGFRQPFC